MSKTPASGPGRLRVLTYNVHKGYCRANRRFVLAAMRRLIADTAADLVFLQEIHGRKDPERRGAVQFPDQPHFEYIADTVWPHVAYGRNAIYREGDHGNAILSKFPLLRWENINVARFPRSSRSILHGVIELPGAAKPLHLLCVHLGLLESERRGQIATLSDRIASHVPADEPLLLAGDFNDWRARAERYLHRSLGVDELFVALEGRHARSYPIWFPMLAMDRIYYRGLEPLGATVLSGGEWRELSDHAGLLGEFRLPARSTDDRGASAPVNGSPSTPRAAPAAPRSGR